MSYTLDKQRALILAALEEDGLTQAEFARRLGRTQKHVSQVLTGKAGTHELDYWAWVLGRQFVVDLVPYE